MAESFNFHVPRELVKEYLPHPEPYGDYIVVLENGMWTDVYEDENGDLYTITNDEALIDYLFQYVDNQEKEY